MTKPVFGVPDETRLKPVYSATKTYGPLHDKACLWGSWRNETQTSLLSYKNIWASTWQSLSLGFLTKRDSNQSTQLDQGSHRLEKYLNIQDCLEKSLKIKFALKSTWKTLNGLEKSLNFLPFTGGFSSVFEDQNQYEIVLPLFGAAYAAPNKDTTISY